MIQNRLQNMNSSFSCNLALYYAVFAKRRGGPLSPADVARLMRTRQPNEPSDQHPTALSCLQSLFMNVCAEIKMTSHTAIMRQALFSPKTSARRCPPKSRWSDGAAGTWKRASRSSHLRQPGCCLSERMASRLPCALSAGGFLPPPAPIEPVAPPQPGPAPDDWR